MTSKLLGATGVALILAGSAAAALAQTRATRTSRAAPAAAAAPAPTSAAPVNIPVTHGPPIPGICLFSHDEMLAQSSVGQAYSNRMQQLIAQSRAEFSAQQTALRTDEQAYLAKRSTLTPEQQQQQGAPLAQREQMLQQQAQERQEQLQLTGSHAIQRIDAVATPIVAQVYQAHRCSILFTRDAALIANPAMDITPQVAQELNTRMSTISFDLESLPPGTR